MVINNISNITIQWIGATNTGTTTYYYPLACVNGYYSCITSNFGVTGNAIISGIDLSSFTMTNHNGWFNFIYIGSV